MKKVLKNWSLLTLIISLPYVLVVKFITHEGISFMNIHRVVVYILILSVISLVSRLIIKILNNEKVKILYLNLKNLISCLLVVEIVFSIVLYYYSPKKILKEKRGDYKFKSETVGDRNIIKDSLLIYASQPNYTVYEKTFYDGKLMNDGIIYRTDSNGYRIGSDTISAREDFAVFFGDSFTYGSYVQQDSTLAAFFESLNLEYKSFNYGVGGYGPQQMWLQAKYLIEPDTFGDGDGLFVCYLSGDDQLNRLFGTFRTDFHWYEDHPWLVRDEDGQIKKNGQIKEKNGYAFLSLLRQLNTVKFFNIKIPWKFTEYHFEFLADVISDTALTLREKFPNSRFIVVNFPTTTIPYEKYLDDFVEVLDLSHLKAQFETNTSYRVRGDSHPTGLANYDIANELIQYLNK